MATSQDGQKFLTRGSHSIVSACSLPADAPQPVMELMNRHFGKVLIEEIKKLLSDDTRISKDNDSSTSDSLHMYNSPGCGTSVLSRVLVSGGGNGRQPLFKDVQTTCFPYESRDVSSRQR